MEGQQQQAVPTQALPEHVPLRQITYQGLLRSLGSEAEALQKIHVRIQRQLQNLEIEEKLIMQMVHRERSHLSPEELEEYDQQQQHQEHEQQQQQQQQDHQQLQPEAAQQQQQQKARTLSMQQGVQPEPQNNEQAPAAADAAAAANLAARDGGEVAHDLSADVDMEEL